MRVNDVRLRPNIKLYELECKDGSHEVIIRNDMVLDMFQALHDQIEVELDQKVYMIFNSFYRSEAHNNKIGGSPNSRHTKGDAGDVHFIVKETKKRVDPSVVAAVAEKIGFDGIGVYETFTHCDMRGYKARWGIPFCSI